MLPLKITIKTIILLTISICVKNTNIIAQEIFNDTSFSKHYFNGNYPFLLQSLSQNIKSNPDNELSKEKVQLAFLYVHLHENDKAFNLVQSLINIKKIQANKYLPDLLDLYGEILLQNGFINKAKIQFDKALKIREKRYGKKSPELAISYLNLGWLAKVNNNLDGAIKYHNLATADLLANEKWAHYYIENEFLLVVANTPKRKSKKALKTLRNIKEVCANNFSKNHLIFSKYLSLQGYVLSFLGETMKPYPYKKKQLQ